MFHYDISDATVSQVTLQHGVEIISDMFKTHEQTYSGGKNFNYKFGSSECVKGHTMHPK